MRASILGTSTGVLWGCLQQAKTERSNGTSACIAKEAGSASAAGSTSAASAVLATGCSAPAQHNADQQTRQLLSHSRRRSMQQLCYQSQQLMQPLPWALNMAQTQQSLMQGLQLHMQPGHLLFATSACLHKRQSRSCSGSAQLHHQPSKHSQGPDPLKLLKAANAAAAAAAAAGGPGAAATVPQAAAEAAPPTAEIVKESWLVRFRAGAQRWLSRVKASAPTMALVIFTCLTAFLGFWIVAQQAILENTRHVLAGKNPAAITHHLSSLHWLMSQDFAQKLVDKGVIPGMVALVEPGADAILLCHLFVLLDQLLAYGGDTKDALLQSGLLETLTRGLNEGWMPRGAVQAAGILRQRLDYQHQRRLPPAKSTSK